MCVHTCARGHSGVDIVVFRNGEVMLAEGKLSVEDSGRLLSECHELLCAVAEFAHGRCTKLLGFRAKVRV